MEGQRNEQIKAQREKEKQKEALYRKIVDAYAAARKEVVFVKPEGFAEEDVKEAFNPYRYGHPIRCVHWPYCPGDCRHEQKK